MDSGSNNQRVNVIVNYEYTASEPDELTLRVGETVRDVERLPGGWWRGELRGRCGMFPDNFVTVHESNQLNRSEGPSGRCKVAFSYQPANPDELSLTLGETLEVLGEVEEGWWQGRTKQGKIGVFPSNFVVLMDKPPSRPLSEEAPRLPPKPVKEQCRVLFPYTAMNEDELTLQEGDVLTLLSREGPDRGWWRGELRGRVGLFPDNFVTVIPNTATEVEEKRPDRPPAKNIYPVLNKYSEKTASVKELTTSKTSLHKETTIGKETTTHRETTVTHGNKSDQERTLNVENYNSLERHDDTADPTGKKPPVPAKKSPTPPSVVGGLFSGLKSKIISSSDKDKWTTVSSSTSSSSGEWDKLDGVSSSKAAPAPAAAAAPAAAFAPVSAPTDGFDHVERNTMLSDPRAGRVKAPRRRPPSQLVRDDAPQPVGLSNGQHDSSSEKSEKTEKLEPIKPKAREWEKHRAPWMEELKLNQAKKTSFIETSKSRSASTSSDGPPARTSLGSTDKIIECGVEEKKSTHSLEMSKSMSSITNRLSVVETFEETKTRHSLDSNKKEAPPPVPTSEPPTSAPPPAPTPTPAPTLNSPTAAGRTLTAMLDEIKKPQAPSPPVAGTRTSTDLTGLTNSSNSSDKRTSSVSEKVVMVERLSSGGSGDSSKVNKDTVSDQTLIAQLNDRILNLERLVEAQSVRFSSAIEELSGKLAAETRSRLALQAETEKLAHCVTQAQAKGVAPAKDQAKQPA